MTDEVPHTQSFSGMGSERRHNANAKVIFITRASWQASRKGQGLMIMKYVTIFNVLKSTELGGFTWVIIIIAHHTSGVISDAFSMAFYLIFISTQ